MMIGFQERRAKVIPPKGKNRDEIAHDASSSPLIGDKVLENYNFLYRLAKTRSEARRFDLLQNATPIELLTLVEIAKNYKHAGYRLPKRAFIRLAPYADCVRKLSRTRSERSAKRVIVQKGGGGFLASLIIPLLAEAAQQLILRISK